MNSQRYQTTTQTLPNQAPNGQNNFPSPLIIRGNPKSSKNPNKSGNNNGTLGSNSNVSNQLTQLPNTNILNKVLAQLENPENLAMGSDESLQMLNQQSYPQQPHIQPSHIQQPQSIKQLPSQLTNAMIGNNTINNIPVSNGTYQTNQPNIYQGTNYYNSGINNQPQNYMGNWEGKNNWTTNNVGRIDEKTYQEYKWLLKIPRSLSQYFRNEELIPTLEREKQYRSEQKRHEQQRLITDRSSLDQKVREMERENQLLRDRLKKVEVVFGQFFNVDNVSPHNNPSDPQQIDLLMKMKQDSERLQYENQQMRQWITQVHSQLQKQNPQ